ncbi:MAG: hypothetical protein ACRC31_02935, partial [Cetobacterium sp.]
MNRIYLFIDLFEIKSELSKIFSSSDVIDTVHPGECDIIRGCDIIIADVLAHGGDCYGSWHKQKSSSAG